MPALVAHLATLLALVRWRENGRTGWLWAAGAWQGAALALSIKAVFGLAGVMAVVAGLPRRGGTLPTNRAGSLARLLGGMALVLILLIAVLIAFTGIATLGGLYHDVVLDSLRFVDFEKTWPVFGSEVGVFLAAALGLALVLRVRGLAILGHPVHGVLLLPTLAGVSALFLPRTPAVYQHAWLPLLPVVAIYAGLTLATLAEWARQDPTRWRKGLVLAAIAWTVVVPTGATLIAALRNQNAADVRLMRRELRLACTGEPVLDGTALYIFRPAAYRYGALIRGVREWVARASSRRRRSPTTCERRELRSPTRTSGSAG